MRPAPALGWCALVLSAFGCGARAHPRHGDAGASDGGEPDAQAEYELVEANSLGCARPVIPPGLPVLDLAPACDSSAGAVCLRTIACRYPGDCVYQEHGHCEASSATLCSDADGGITQRACSADADCAPTPGRQCLRVIVSSHCEYDDCLHDDVCAAGERCVCQGLVKMCLPADCALDTDCPRGQRCRPDGDCFFDPNSFHCSTPEDSCARHADCGDQQRCVFSEGSFRCVEACANPI